MNSVEEHAAYLAAIIDGEGSVCCKGSVRYITLCNTDFGVIEYTEKCLNLLDIKYSKRFSETWRDKKIATIQISGRGNLIRAFVRIPLKSIKRKKLGQIVQEFHKSNHRAKRPSKEILREEYQSGLTQREIGLRYGVGRDTVRRWMNEYEISTRYTRSL